MNLLIMFLITLRFMLYISISTSKRKLHPVAATAGPASGRDISCFGKLGFEFFFLMIFLLNFLNLANYSSLLITKSQILLDWNEKDEYIIKINKFKFFDFLNSIILNVIDVNYSNRISYYQFKTITFKFIQF